MDKESARELYLSKFKRNNKPEEVLDQTLKRLEKN